MTDRFVRFKEACQILGIGRSTAYRKLNEDPNFPKLVKPLGPDTRPSAFLQSELEQYRNLRLSERESLAA